MHKKIILSFLTVIFFIILANLFLRDTHLNLKLDQLRKEFAIQPIPSVDHSKLPELQRAFATPQQVTLACLECHTESHKEVMKSSHWNWERLEYIEGRGIMALGKKNAFNNFCISASSNEQSCAKCHIGFGMKNSASFDFESRANVDCMVCHDNSQEYHKGSKMAGYPARSVNLTKVAQHVGSPTKMNCGSCHFYSGGGNNVKHGDLEQALLAADRDVDVHMAANGMDMSCVTCHTAENHVMKGKLYSVSSENINRANCQDCHTSSPHIEDVLNEHNERVACQTCHIPEYAKVNATKMHWRWSKAGKLKDGKPYHIDNKNGDHTYLSIKGEFKWEKNVKPDYVWFNGTAEHYYLGDKVKEIPVQVNKLNGSYDDKNSKIIPVKIHRGDQIWDPENKLLIQPKLVSTRPGDGGFWKYFNWDDAAAAGMKQVGLPYSGKYDFVETEMYWPVNHMVSPKEKALGCEDCHTRNDGRLAKLTGFYLPGRDSWPWLDFMGAAIFYMTLLGVFAHGFLRFRPWWQQRKENKK